MLIEQFRCKTYKTIQQAKCNKECIRATESHPEGVVCSELRIKYIMSADWETDK